MAATHGWVRVEREVRQRTALGLIHVPNRLEFCANTGERMLARGSNADPATMKRPKYQLPTHASGTPDDVGPDVAAECERPKEVGLNFGRYQA